MKKIYSLLILILISFSFNFLIVKADNKKTYEYSVACLSSYRIGYINGSYTMYDGGVDCIDEDGKLLVDADYETTDPNSFIKLSLTDPSYKFENLSSYTIFTKHNIFDSIKQFGGVNKTNKGKLGNFSTMMPVLRIIYYVDTDNVHHIINVAETSGDNEDMSAEVKEMMSIYGEFPVTIYTAELHKYDKEKNSIYAPTKDGRKNNENFCKKHPEDPWCVHKEPKEPEPEEPTVEDKDFEFCSSSGVLRTFSIIRTMLSIGRILAPIILIITASIALGKAVVANDDKELSKAVKTCVINGIVSVVIFFIPTITYTVIHLAKKDDLGFKNCEVCLNGNREECKNLISGADTE